VRQAKLVVSYWLKSDMGKA